MNFEKKGSCDQKMLIFKYFKELNYLITILVQMNSHLEDLIHRVDNREIKGQK